MRTHSVHGHCTCFGPLKGTHQDMSRKQELMGRSGGFPGWSPSSRHSSRVEGRGWAAGPGVSLSGRDRQPAEHKFPRCARAGPGPRGGQNRGTLSSRRTSAGCVSPTAAGRFKPRLRCLSRAAPSSPIAATFVQEEIYPGRLLDNIACCLLKHSQDEVQQVLLL